MMETEKEWSTFELSKRFKRKMNRFFREEVGTENIPHPEVDNLWERLRSKIKHRRK